MSTFRLEKTLIQSPVSNEMTLLSGNIEARPITLGLFKLPNGEKNNGYMLRTEVWMRSIGLWKKLKQKKDERPIKRGVNIGHQKSKPS